MTTRSKSTLFLVEQLIVIAVFALCAVACISILTVSYYMAVDARDTADALSEAQIVAERFKARGGDVNSFYRFTMPDSLEINSDDESFSLTAYYNDDWQWVASGSDDTAFVLCLSGNITNNYDGSIFCRGTVSVSRATGEPLVNLPVAVRR